MDSQKQMPSVELDRLSTLSDFNLDYTNFENNFKGLALLAARIAGTAFSHVNIIDSSTQWTISYYGLKAGQQSREDTVCQYTILQPDHFEISNLSEDDRFRDKAYVKEGEQLRYYYGVPLKSAGHNIGALCVLDKETKTLSAENAALLQIISEEIVDRLNAYRAIELLRSQIDEVTSTKNKVAHDIRGPLSGMVGLAAIYKEQGLENKIEELLDFTEMVHNSGSSILDLANEILTSGQKNSDIPTSNLLNLVSLREKLERLYSPQASSKKIALMFTITEETRLISFPKNKLLQICGNLISNAIKFTPEQGQVNVFLKLKAGDERHDLQIRVEDSGKGLDQECIDQVLHGVPLSTSGTNGEQGYGLGLELVKRLIDGLSGRFKISSAPGAGACFEVTLPQVVRQ